MYSTVCKATFNLKIDISIERSLVPHILIYQPFLGVIPGGAATVLLYIIENQNDLLHCRQKH